MHAHGAPGLVAVRRADEHAGDSVGAGDPLEDAHLVVGEPHALDLREEPHERATQGAIEGVDGAVALGGDDDPLAAGMQLHCRLAHDPAVCLLLHDRAPRLDREGLGASTLRLVEHEQLEGCVGCLEGPARGLEVLHALDHLGQRRGIVGGVEAELASLELDRGAPGHLGDEDALVVAHDRGVDVVVELGIDLERTRMQTGLVREGRDSGVGLMGVGCDVGDLRDGVGDAHRLAELALGEHTHIELGLEIGHDGEEVGIAGAFAVAVGSALHVGDACLHSRDRVGDGAAGVVLAVDAQTHAGALLDLLDDLVHPVGQHPAVGVAHHADVSTSLEGHLEDAYAVVAIVPVAVEEVLHVDEDATVVLAQEAHRVGDHGEVLFIRRAQRLLDVTHV